MNLITYYYQQITTSDITMYEISPYRRVIRLHMNAQIQTQILENCEDVYNKANKLSYF